MDSGSDVPHINPALRGYIFWAPMPCLFEDSVNFRAVDFMAQKTQNPKKEEIPTIANIVVEDFSIFEGYHMSWVMSF